MIIVTGTKRSGTSLWMQVLLAAGHPAFGEAFPRRWGETLRDANPEGFYESILREGIYWRTNPHPRTGDYFFPEQVERHVVKVFIPGLVRTDRAFIGSVIATMRSWREYVTSLERLYAMEDVAREKEGRPGPPPRRMPPALEWWQHNFMLLRDIVTRRYRVHVQSYDGLLADPAAVVRETLAWLGGVSEADVAAAVAAVKPERRTQLAPRSAASDPGVEPAIATVFDELYDAVDRRRPLTPAFIAHLNETHRQLAPRLEEHRRAIVRDMRRRRARGPNGPDDGSTEPPSDDEPPPSW
jgi:hypothetical protein